MSFIYPDRNFNPDFFNTQNPELYGGVDRIPEEYRLTEEKRKAFLRVKGAIGFDVESDTDHTVHSSYHVREGVGKHFGLTYLTEITFLSLYHRDVGGVVITNPQIYVKQIIEFLLELFARDDVTFVAHNLIFDWRLVSKYLIKYLIDHSQQYNFVDRYLKPPAKFWDTLAMEFLFAERNPRFGGPENSFALLPMANRYGIEITDASRTMKDARKVLSTLLESEDGAQRIAEYVVQDSKVAVDIYYAQINKARRLYDQDHYLGIKDAIRWEQRFTRVCAWMTQTGIPIDRTYLAQQKETWSAQYKEVLAEMRGLVEDHINAEMRRYSENKQNEKYAWSVYQEFIQLRENLGELKRELKQYPATMKDPYTGKRHTIKENRPIRDELNASIKEVKRKVAEVEREIPLVFEDIKRTYGFDPVIYLMEQGFNPARQFDLQYYLFEVVDLQVKPNILAYSHCYTATGNPSFSAEALTEYEDYGRPIELLKQFRDLTDKIKASVILENHSAVDDRVHSMIVSRTVTGRTSSSQPNMQNRNKANDAGIFTPMPNHVLLEIDVERAELWMSAMMAGDSAMASMLASEDFHSVTRDQYFPEKVAYWSSILEQYPDPENQMHKKAFAALIDLRKVAKGINFGTAYGMGPSKFARHTEVDKDTISLDSRELVKWQQYTGICSGKYTTDNGYRSFTSWSDGEIKKANKKYGKNYPTLDNFDPDPDIVRQIEYCQWIGALPQNLYEAHSEEWEYAGRIYVVKKILENRENTFGETARTDYIMQQFAERQGYIELWSGVRRFVTHPKDAWNVICQGGVADIVRRWAVVLMEYMLDNPHLDSYIVDYVHDSMILMVPVEFQEHILKTAGYLLSTVLDTNPYDREGIPWADRTDPPSRFVSPFEGDKNAQTWGYLPRRDVEVLEVDMVNVTEDDLDKTREAVDNRLYEYLLNSRALPQEGYGSDGITLGEVLAGLEWGDEEERQNVIDIIERELDYWEVYNPNWRDDVKLS